MTGKIRILIVDDHAIVREGLSGLIAVEPDMQVAGEASNGLEGVRNALTLKPDIILMDLVMPEMDGIQAIQEIKNQDSNARILVLTSFADDDKLFPAIKAGATGYILKDTLPHELLAAIRDVYRGESSLHPSIALKVLKELQPRPQKPPLAKEAEDVALTERETDVLKLIAQGHSNQEIAEKLVLSERTVHSHVNRILTKLHLASRTQAALYALRKGIASLDQDQDL